MPYLPYFPMYLYLGLYTPKSTRIRGMSESDKGKKEYGLTGGNSNGNSNSNYNYNTEKTIKKEKENGNGNIMSIEERLKLLTALNQRNTTHTHNTHTPKMISKTSVSDSSNNSNSNSSRLYASDYLNRIKNGSMDNNNNNNNNNNISKNNQTFARINKINDTLMSKTISNRNITTTTTTTDGGSSSSLSNSKKIYRSPRLSTHLSKFPSAFR